PKSAPRPEPDVQVVGGQDGAHDATSAEDPTWTHAARRSGPAVRNDMSTVEHSGTVTGQRGWNGQPLGRSRGSGGSPGRPRGARRDAGSPMIGNAWASAWA